MSEIIKLFPRPAMVLVSMFALAVIFYVGTKHIYWLVEDAVTLAKQECNSRWRAEIARANEIAARQLADQQKAAFAAETQAQDEIKALIEQLGDLERDNATLPDTTCGIDRSRVRLLDKQAPGGR